MICSKLFFEDDCFLLGIHYIAITFMTDLGVPLLQHFHSLFSTLHIAMYLLAKRVEEIRMRDR